MEDADEKRCADGPGMYQLADLAMGARVAQMVVGAHNDARFGAGGDHLPRIDEVKGKRLLA